MEDWQRVANMIDGNEYTNELEGISISAVKNMGIVILFGGSDDLAEFHGAMDDEVGCCNGGTILLTNKGLLENRCDDEDCPYHEEEKKTGIPIEAIWNSEGYSWTYKTDIPHKTFDIMEDDDKYCRGIVFYLKDVKEEV